MRVAFSWFKIPIPLLPGFLQELVVAFQHVVVLLPVLGSGDAADSRSSFALHFGSNPLLRQISLAFFFFCYVAGAGVPFRILSKGVSSSAPFLLPGSVNRCCTTCSTKVPSSLRTWKRMLLLLCSSSISCRGVLSR